MYLKTGSIRGEIDKAVSERGTDWLNGVIEYHCSGGYGRSHHLSGYDGYIAALEERQRRELGILRGLNVQYMVLDDPHKDWDRSYSEIMRRQGHLPQ